MIRIHLVLLAALCVAGCDRSDRQANTATLPPVAASLDMTQHGAETSAIPVVLKTKNFVVTITNDHPEGKVTSDQVKYFAISRRTGSSLRLTGSTLQTHSADGTPARLLGYEFKNGNTTYRVYQDGQLIVTRGKSHQVVVDELGTWQ